MICSSGSLSSAPSAQRVHLSLSMGDAGRREIVSRVRPREEAVEYSTASFESLKRLQLEVDLALVSVPCREQHRTLVCGHHGASGSVLRSSAPR